MMIYKYYSNLSEYAVKNFENDMLCFSHVDEFNDNLEFDAKYADELCKGLEQQAEFFRQEQIKEQKFRLRVCCFCQRDDLENMWGYYANGGKGFCLKYDAENLKSISSELVLKEVEYFDKIPTFDDNMTPKDMIIAQTCHKKKCWQEEQEFRAIAFLSDNYLFNQDMRMGGFEPWTPLVDGVVTQELSIGAAIKGEKIPYKCYSPKHVSINLRPKELILGRRCEKHFENELIAIAKEKGIPWRKHGESNG